MTTDAPGAAVVVPVGARKPLVVVAVVTAVVTAVVKGLIPLLAVPPDIVPTAMVPVQKAPVGQHAT